jgi:hypothetical protein
MLNMSKSDIKFLVLTALGYVERPNFEQTDDNAVKLVNEEYEHYLSLCVSKNKWNFFTAQTELTQEEDEGKWKYKYAVPDNMELLNNVYCDEKYTRPVRRFEMHGGYIHTDSERVFVDYRKKVCEQTLAPYFVEWFRLFMAYGLCQNITGDSNLEQSLFVKQERAFIEAKAFDN